jgi:ParB family chromosome partitioning protein
MQIVEIPLRKLREAPWNPNRMDANMLERLRASIMRYGLISNLVVRLMGSDSYEVLSGNHRLKLMQDLGMDSAFCVVLELDDAQARLLAQALNHIRGQDDLGLRAVLLRDVMKTLTQEEVLAVLPEGAEGLNALASLGQDTMAGYLQKWENARPARLKHLVFQLTTAQLETVQQALEKVLPLAKESQGDSPNARGTGLYLLSKAYLEGKGQP